MVAPIHAAPTGVAGHNLSEAVAANFSSPYQAVAEADGNLKVAATESGSGEL
jgi:hypothetical protein